MSRSITEPAEKIVICVSVQLNEVDKACSLALKSSRLITAQLASAGLNCHVF